MKIVAPQLAFWPCDDVRAPLDWSWAVAAGW